MGVGLKERQQLVGQLSMQKANLFRRTTTTEVTNEKRNKSEQVSPPITAWSCVMDGHATHFNERYCELEGTSASALMLAETPCMLDH